MEILPTSIPEVLLIRPAVFGDARGWFLETWQQKRYAELGLPSFVQDNVSFSQRGVLRGLHYQHPHGQGKLVQVLQGRVFDAAVDIRVGSPTFGRYVCAELSSDNHLQMYIPPGFAHGFCVLSETALFSYKCTDFYRPDCEGGVCWNDPEIGIAWPIAEPILSAKDSRYGPLRQISPSRLPVYERA
ncbi:MAG: dTDP-4-dehydrorhamnose 3,5-epimerase [Anaerohalosphaeraceae bacterium]